MKAFDFDFYRFPKVEKAKDMTVLFGGSSAKMIPADELCESFGFNFKVENASTEGLSVKNAKAQYKMTAEALKAESVIVQLGENDIELFKSNPAEFDTLYLDFIGYLKSTDSKLRIQLVSVGNPNASQNVGEMNRHIKAIAASERCEFFNIESAKLWKPCSTTAAASFLYKIGFDSPLKVKHPLYDTAKALFSYLYSNDAVAETHRNAS
jgi:hypothetical protein